MLCMCRDKPGASAAEQEQEELQESEGAEEKEPKDPEVEALEQSMRESIIGLQVPTDEPEVQHTDPLTVPALLCSRGKIKLCLF